MKPRLRLLLLIPAVAVLAALGIATAAGEGSFASLDRIVSQIAEKFPPLEGVVVSIENDEIVLDLKEGDPINVGDKLNLIRFGEDLFHPTTKQKIGRKETELGQVRVTRISKNFSTARPIGGLVKAQAGDGVRLPFQKIAFLIAPIRATAAEKIDTSQIALELEKRLKANPRFDVPAFDLGPWMLEQKVSVKTLPDNLDLLAKKIKADFVIVPEIRTVQNQTVMSYELLSFKEGKSVAKNEVLSERMPIVADFGGKSPIKEHGRAQEGNEAVAFLASQDFDYEIADIAVGDINGDGKKDYIIIDSYRVMVYKFENNLFRMVAMYKGKNNVDKFINVDAADLNGNGRDEIFVTNHAGESLNSFVLEANTEQKRLEKIWENQKLYFRAIQPPDAQKPILLAQGVGYEYSFVDGINQLEYKKGKYQVGEPLPLPKLYGEQFIVYGFNQADLSSKEAGRETIILDKDYHLRVYSPSGRLLEKSEEYYGHDPRYITAGLRADIIGMPQQRVKATGYRGRIRFVRFPRELFVVVPRNHRFGNELAQNMVIVNDSSMAILRVTKEGFSKYLETNTQQGFVAGFEVMDGPDPGEKKLHVATAYSGGLMPGKSTSSIHTYIWKGQTQ